MTHDLIAAREAVAAQRLRPSQALAHNFEAARSPALAPAFVRTFESQAEAAARAAELQLDHQLPLGPLAGLAISVKDLFDVQGQPTTGGSRVLAAATPATADSAAVARLRQAGAALVGHTHMTEFAFSGVGLNPHHATPLNVAAARLGGEARIPGGSSSGAATSVAGGAAWAALGSDTGGSIRIPAALQGLVGFKNTARLTPTRGALPLSTTLDTACAITRSVRDAVLMHEVLAARTVQLTRAPLSRWRLGIATPLLNGTDATVARAFQRSIDTLRHAGAQIEELPLVELGELAAITSTGGFSAAEAWAWHRHRLAEHEALYDPRVAQRIRRGATMSAADYIDLLHARTDWISRMTTRLSGIDALLSPTVPIVPPKVASLASDEAFFEANGLLLRNPATVNMLDGCGLSLPCHQADELPVGLMVWHSALHDDTVLDVSLAIEAALQEGSA